MLQIFLYLLAGTAGLFLGLMGGCVLMDLRLRYGLKVVMASIFRVTRKKWLRATNPNFDLLRVERDRVFLELPVEQRVGQADGRAMAAATELKQRLDCHFKDQIQALYLFGSRVRGDYQPDSDVDVGIFLREMKASDLLRKEICSHSREILLKYGLFIQPRIFGAFLSEDTLEDAEKHLSGIVVSYGIPVEALQESR